MIPEYPSDSPHTAMSRVTSLRGLAPKTMQDVNFDFLLLMVTPQKLGG